MSAIVSLSPSNASQAGPDASAVAIRSLAAASEASEELANSTSGDATVMLAQVGALIAHEVNNLLSPALARCDLLRAAVGPGSEAYNLIDGVQVSIAQAAEVARVVLKIAGGETTNACASVGTAISHTVRLLLPEATRARVAVVGGDSYLRVRLSEGELSHVLLNVLLNALKAINTNQGWVEVEVREVLHADCSKRNTGRRMVAISVRDSGRGVDGDLLKKCYRTLSWEQGRFVGKNLGTLLCRMIVERAGGQIDVVSSPGKGTTVTVLLPEAS